MQWATRIADSSETRWVISTWLECHRRHAADLARKVPAPEYWRRWRTVVERLVAASTVVIAHHPETPDVALGWACYQAGTDRHAARLHYVFVRERGWRGLGIARALVAPLRGPVQYSHRTEIVDPARLPDNWEHAPWLLLGV